MEERNNTVDIAKAMNIFSTFGLFAIVIFCGILAFIPIPGGLSLQQEALNSEQWTTVTGLILFSEIEYRPPDSFDGELFIPRITFSYPVDEKNFTGTRISFYLDFVMGFPNESMAAQYLQKYPVDSSVSVYYDPSDHSNSVLEPGSNNIINTYWRHSSLLVFAAGIIFSFFGRITFFRNQCKIDVKILGLLYLFLLAIFAGIVLYLL
ncbi:MAG: DUF3592 domain-containing protein [Candidatus Hodarchaeales archaeon]|jgi:hypothetical protein